MTTHVLKCVAPHFDDVANGQKNYEVRLDDRGFEVGDLLVLREYDWVEDSYSGFEERRRVTHVLRDFAGLTPGWVALGLEGES